MLHFQILTLFPEIFPGPLDVSVTKKAFEKQLWAYNAVNIRDFATDNYRSVDDTPFGGGAGMVMRADILESALLASPPPKNAKTKRIYMSPRGKPLSQGDVQDLVQYDHLTILCGRYEGVDQRFLDEYDFEEVSIGDFVLAGGELPALTLMEACIRLIPGALGNAHTVDEESFSNGLLEYPHYTKPASWLADSGATYDVPQVLRSGNHAKIDQWRLEQSLNLTKERRPDLLKDSEGDKS